MANNNGKKGAKQQRAQSNRKAREEAAARAREEQLARERKQQTIIGAAVVAMVVALIALIVGIIVYQSHKKAEEAKITSSQTYATLQKVKTKPAKADDKGGFLISKNGIAKSVSGAPTVEIYMDPICPGCGSLHRQIDDDLQKMVNAGQINLVYHSASFLDGSSTDKYSTRASGAVAYIASHDNDKDHLMRFVANLYSEDFQPGEASDYKPTSNDQIKAQAIKAGVPKNVADKAFDGRYTAWLDAVDNYTMKRNDLLNTDGQLKGQMSTPTVTINGKLLSMNRLSELNLTQKTGLLKSIGLKPSDVGHAGVMPKIGEKGKPIDLG
ncbi:Protein-disulfide isomerase [Bifidobacterium bohemicum]|uniref:Putative DSBA thioredoxin domain-containing protein n=1 Tax=Bifidobacterium bohemicum DSM 22767 TaxID=1437606 RepID=A0A086ZH54_9BIFI|nr:thioredoxin domain-containing protein [Bifidobacterium bohemicum]KFI45854.1 putative DSBA thioredoxin domain-containing protein [Bifidobacterium bohemicum DSM 22767]SCC15616.1 Protein-disulfide isomerase [Bifidobacterium bohemicum]